MSKMISRREIPMGTSTRPVFLTLPVREKILVPGLVSVPMERNQSAPFRMIWGTLAQVSTLLMLVGFPHRPFWAGNGGRGRGCPRRPSMEAKSAVSSPQTNAPAPSNTWRRKEKPDPRMSSPRRPSSSACRIAIRRCFTARGYSALT